MARTYQFDSASEISLDEYIEWVSNNVDERDVESLSDSAFMLYRLSLNKRLFNNILLSPIKNSALGVQPENQYTDATFILGYANSGGIIIRANLWKSPKKRNGSDSYERDLYSYEIPHDHNFDFITVGYYGPGYTTDIYNYSRDNLNLVIGETVDIKFLETITLETGKIILFEKSKDIHTQRPPLSPSISLNLICVTEEQSVRQQCFFDIDKSILSGYAKGPTASRVQVIKMLGYLGIDDSIDPLMAIVRKYPCTRTKAAAIRSIISIAPEKITELYSLCGHETSPLIIDALAIR